MKDDMTPATKVDIQDLRRSIDKLHGDIDLILQLLINKEKETSSALKDHERRILRVERRIGIGVR